MAARDRRVPLDCGKKDPSPLSLSTARFVPSSRGGYRRTIGYHSRFYSFLGVHFDLEHTGRVFFRFRSVALLLLYSPLFIMSFSLFVLSTLSAEMFWSGLEPGMTWVSFWIPVSLLPQCKLMCSSRPVSDILRDESRLLMYFTLFPLFYRLGYCDIPQFTAYLVVFVLWARGIRGLQSLRSIVVSRHGIPAPCFLPRFCVAAFG